MIHAEVHLWGTRIGAVSLPREGDPAAVFEYDETFISAAKDIEPAPLKMKRRPGLFSFPEDSLRTFHGLPGLLVDSLPDKFGTSLLNRWFAETGKNPESLNIIERLLYMADRGMGALSYQPSRSFIEDSPIHELDMEDLGRLANMVLKRDTKLQLAGRRGQAALDLIRVGTSAGGARAKALVAEDSLGKFKPGHVIYPDPHRYWLLKFDGV